MVFAFVFAAAIVGSVAIESDLTCPTSEGIAAPLPRLLGTPESVETKATGVEPRFVARLTDVGEFLYLRVSQNDKSLLCERSFEKPAEAAEDRCSGLAQAIAIAVASCLPAPVRAADDATSAVQTSSEISPRPRWALALRAGAAYGKDFLGLGELDFDYSGTWWMFGGRLRATSVTTHSISFDQAAELGQIRWHRQAFLMGPGWHSNPQRPFQLQIALRFGGAWFRANSEGFDEDFTRHRFVPVIAPSVLGRRCWGAWCLEMDVETDLWPSPLRLAVAQKGAIGEATSRKYLEIPRLEVGATLGIGVRF
ncbi:MAG: hypothetical protein QM784_04070 [Polyangiaceae bacterium]